MTSTNTCSFFLKSLSEAFPADPLHPVVSITTKDSVRQTLEILQSNDLRVTPMLDNNGGIVDLVSIEDILRFVAIKLPERYALSVTELKQLEVAGLQLGHVTMIELWKTIHGSFKDVMRQKKSLMDTRVVYPHSRVLNAIEKFLGVEGAERALNIQRFGFDERLSKSHLLVLDDRTRQIIRLISTTDVVTLFLKHLAEETSDDHPCDLAKMARLPVSHATLALMPMSDSEARLDASAPMTATSARTSPGRVAIQVTRQEESSQKRRKLVVTASPATSVFQAISLLIEKKIDSCPIVATSLDVADVKEGKREQRLIGNFSLSDARGLFAQQFGHLLDGLESFLEVYSPKSLIVDLLAPNTPLQDALKRMRELHVHQVYIRGEHQQPDEEHFDASQVGVLNQKLTLVLLFRLYYGRVQFSPEEQPRLDFVSQVSQQHLLAQQSFYESVPSSQEEKSDREEGGNGYVHIPVHTGFTQARYQQDLQPAAREKSLTVTVNGASAPYIYKVMNVPTSNISCFSKDNVIHVKNPCWNAARMPSAEERFEDLKMVVPNDGDVSRISAKWVESRNGRSELQLQLTVPAKQIPEQGRKGLNSRKRSHSRMN